MHLFNYQEEMERLKRESSALRTTVEAEISQSKNLQSKFNNWEQSAEQQLFEGKKYRQVRKYKALYAQPLWNCPVSDLLTLSKKKCKVLNLFYANEEKLN